MKNAKHYERLGRLTEHWCNYFKLENYHEPQCSGGRRRSENQTQKSNIRFC